MKNILLFLALAFSASAFCAYRETGNVKVQAISVWAGDSGILVQTNPRHSLQGLNCTNDYWLSLDKSKPGYEVMLSMLLAAQMSQKAILVRAADSGSEYCTLERVITYP